ncbi:MAG: hypothetical protein GXY14_05845 [Spirochaetes bacterium]|nr:hypothetical protein [Spirochaetota bacterium]
MKNMHTAILMTAIILLQGVFIYAMQPFELIRKNPAGYYVKQGAGQCGPASFYIIFRYDGDDRRAYRFSKGKKGPLFSMQINDQAVGQGGNAVVIDRKSPVSKWMNGRSGSTGWNELTAAVKGLYYLNSSNVREKFYSSVESNDRATEPVVKNLEQRRSEFFERIVPAFLNRNRPVIVHLKRKWPYPGHYIVLAGYDPVSRTVYYIDPNGSSEEILRSVQVDDFTGTYWYESSRELRWGRACWNGQWIGFSRN